MKRKMLTGKTIAPSTEEINAQKAKEQIVYSGFVAQDVEKAAKDLNYDFSGVDQPKNDKDLYGLRYSEFVVPLVKAVQELSAKNDELEQRVEKLEALLSQQTSTTGNAKTVTLSNVSLQQNAPNPFQNNTVINYTLPAKYNTAKLTITDKNGTVIKEISLSGNGNGSIKIDAANLSASSYNYSLFIDGKLIASKQMIITK